MRYALRTLWKDRSFAAMVVLSLAIGIGAKFLNVVEGVLSRMTRAVISNSDYPDAMEMKHAISKHFSETWLGPHRNQLLSERRCRSVRFHLVSTDEYGLQFLVGH